jgi:hypothetical protein
MTNTRPQEMGTADTYNSPKTGAPILKLTYSNEKQDRNKGRWKKLREVKRQTEERITTGCE